MTLVSLEDGQVWASSQSVILGTPRVWGSHPLLWFNLVQPQESQQSSPADPVHSGLGW